MERNKALDISRRSRVIEFFTLLNTQRVQEFPNCSPLVPHPNHEWHSELTPFLLHTASTETLVEQPDTETNVYTHALLLDLTRDPVLHKDVRRIGSQLVSSV